MLTILPHFLLIIIGRTFLIRSIGVNILEFKAFKKSSRTQSDQIPGGGPPALLINISGESQASSILFFPSSVVMSHAIAVILTLCEDN